MVQQAKFSIDTRVDVYSSDPKSPWQRESNEKTSGLLPQYFQRHDLSHHTEYDLDQAAYSLNTRPQQTLGDMPPLSPTGVASTPRDHTRYVRSAIDSFWRGRRE